MKVMAYGETLQAGFVRIINTACLLYFEIPVRASHRFPIGVVFPIVS
ncbi:hypothetical protein BBOMB_0499 [Bifidobacterium bombi DSM 19703]|uniref:Uncharacterized protein n=1 Tax=Bifidobacterium bombi DSM 19703 TaxID=1341695 RepID=A0A080N498_9BIFI|nr:hypothetical protein BBOMB_0499 [Bifidobacterium bombi DSM 19703]